MINLVNTSLYSFNKTYDYQSVCDPEKDSKAAAGRRSFYVVSLLTHKEVVEKQDYYLHLFCNVFYINFLSFIILFQPTIADFLSIGWWASSAAW